MSGRATKYGGSMTTCSRKLRNDSVAQAWTPRAATHAKAAAIQSTHTTHAQGEANSPDGSILPPQMSSEKEDAHRFCFRCAAQASQCCSVHTPCEFLRCVRRTSSAAAIGERDRASAASGQAARAAARSCERPRRRPSLFGKEPNFTGKQREALFLLSGSFGPSSRGKRTQ